MAPLISALVWAALLVPSTQNPVPATDGAVSAAATDPAATAQTSQPAQPSQDDPRKEADQTPDKPPTPQHTGSRSIFRGLKGDIIHLPAKDNLLIGAIGGGLALGMHPFDQTVNARLISRSDMVNKIFSPAKYYGSTPEQVALSIGTWAIGRVMHKPKMSHLGMDLLRAQAVTAMLVQPIKLATHRERPDGSDHQSFPSGHAAITFATATVIERHLGWKKSGLAYAIASYVSASRLHDNRHYLSDVIFGAAVGSIAGRTVTEHGRNTWMMMPMPVAGGMAIGITRSGS